MNDTATVYALRLDGHFVYVGRSKDLETRVRSHRTNGKRFDDCVTLAEVPVAQANEVERVAINTYRPILNCTHDGAGVKSLTSVVSVRLTPKLLERFRRVTRPPLSDSVIIRVALGQFCNRYPTLTAAISAVVANSEKDE